MKRIAKTTVAVALLIGLCALVWNLISAPSGEKAFADDIDQKARKQEGAAERAGKYPPATARLFIASSDGLGMKQLDVLPEYAYHGSPRWSPDGKRIAFNVWKHGEDHNSGKIAVVNSDGSSPQVLSDGLMPSFSPRADRMVFSRSAPHYGVWVMSIEGPQPEPVRIDESGWGADWSLDDRIVYSTTTAGRGNLVVFDPADKRRSYLFDEKQSPYLRIYWSMAWSPDSKRIAFKGQTANDKYEVGIVDSRGEKYGLVHRIDGDVLASFAWSSDGSRVLFCKSCAERESRSQIYSIVRDANDPPQLLPGQDSTRSHVDVAASRLRLITRNSGTMRFDPYISTDTIDKTQDGGDIEFGTNHAR